MRGQHKFDDDVFAAKVTIIATAFFPLEPIELSTVFDGERFGKHRILRAKSPGSLLRSQQG
jgi:hypothetical protein